MTEHSQKVLSRTLIVVGVVCLVIALFGFWAASQARERLDALQRSPYSPLQALFDEDLRKIWRNREATAEKIGWLFGGAGAFALAGFFFIRRTRPGKTASDTELSLRDR